MTWVRQRVSLVTIGGGSENGYINIEVRSDGLYLVLSHNEKQIEKKLLTKEEFLKLAKEVSLEETARSLFE